MDMKKLFFVISAFSCFTLSAQAEIKSCEGDAELIEDAVSERRSLTSSDRIEARKARIAKERAERAKARKKAARKGRKRGGGCGPKG